MRSTRFGAFALVVALVVASVALAGDVPAPKNSWTSFKVGSWVVLHILIKTSPEVPEQEGDGETRITLVSINDEEYVLRSEKKRDGEWTDAEEMTHSRKPEVDDAEKKAAPAQALGEEKISIEGTAYVCKKSKTVSEGVTEITWVHKQHGELKSETSGPGDKKSTMIVTALAKKVTVAGKKVSCREEKTVANEDRTVATIVSLTSDEVPSGNVRMEARAVGDGVTVTTLIEVTGFEAK